MSAGQRGHIVDMEGANELRHRLEELGFREGAVIEVVRPGEPSIIAIGNQRLSFRCDSSVMILVEIHTDAVSAKSHP
ncbi:FeoA family protein [Planctomicrobium sp. SH527]|uniref:FeoA family protein n=1 Tax=Planctomicrobium sp. SH527 TaxID=3448123 RepID=UPI003F5B9A6E